MKKYSFFAICIMAIIFAGCDQPSAFHSSGDGSNKPSVVNGIGIFSIAKDKKVTFSKGNLQYTQTTNTWSFAENQWDYIGTDNVTGGMEDKYGSKPGDALAIKIDLFGWSGSTGPAKFGISISGDFHDYSGSFADWGKNKIGDDAPNTWRTLTYEEWDYLLNNRPYAQLLKGAAQVNGVNGLILLPDDWSAPNDVTFKSGFYSFEEESYDGPSGYGLQQTFTPAQWSVLESSGAVFLPASGYRVQTGVGGVQYYGHYWSATEGEDPDGRDYSAKSIAFGSTWNSIIEEWVRVYASSVRLVKDL